MVLSLLAVALIMKFVAFLFILTCVSLVLLVLIQKGKGGGLSGAFGGAGGAGGLMGTKTGDFLTWVTIGLAITFLFLGILMAKYYKSSGGEYGSDQPIRSSVPAEGPEKPSVTEPVVEVDSIDDVEVNSVVE